MIPTAYNLPDAYRGDTFDPIVFVFTNQNDGSPINLSGALAVAQVRSAKNNSLIFQWSTQDNSISILNNMVTFNSVNGDRMKIPAGTHNYDLQINLSGLNETYINGTWTIIKDITDI